MKEGRTISRAGVRAGGRTGDRAVGKAWVTRQRNSRRKERM